MIPRTKKTRTEPITLEECFAKSYFLNGKKELGVTVLEHSISTAFVAKELMVLYHNIFPKCTAFIAAIHDIGKISPTFQKKIRINTQDEENPKLNKVSYEIEKAWGGHAGTGFVSLEGIEKFKYSYIPEIVGLHHGRNLLTSIKGMFATGEKIGGEEWQKLRIDFINKIEELFLHDDIDGINEYSMHIIAGLVSVSDWIASSEWSQNTYKNNEIELYVRKCGFIDLSINDGLSFEYIFGFAPRESQKVFIEAVKEPGVYILEAPMGLGKTEAALYVAYLLISQKKAKGIYFALPTQLTSNKIWDRIGPFLNKIVDNKTETAMLLHSDAWLNMEMGEEGEVGNSWFSEKRRGILAPFAVGTIDQALMAVMNVKYSTVRAFGLASKVIILDEVHTYDSYTGTLLQELIRFLQKIGCTVIILSATLTASHRKKLINKENDKMISSYPLVTSLCHGYDNIKEFEIKVTSSQKFQINVKSDVRECLDEVISRALNGEQVLLLENTVKEAQEIFKLLKARTREYNLEIGLLHSKFVKFHRANIEEKWVNRLGKIRSTQILPLGSILIGTQVLEQSVDIDADFLVTRLAPSDFLLQRLGRLWRRQDTKRIHSAKCEAWIIIPSDGKNFGASKYVYSEYILFRSLEVWQKKSVIVLPDDIRTIIEDTYLERNETSEMQVLLTKLEKERSRLQSFALRTVLNSAGKEAEDHKVSTRYSEMETIEILLIKKFKNNEGIITITLLDDEIITYSCLVDSISTYDKRKIAIKLNQFVIDIPKKDAPEDMSYDKLKYFKPFFFFTYEKCDFFVGIVNECGIITNIGGLPTHLNGEICYSEEVGYEFKKSERNE